MFLRKELFGHPACLLRVGLVGNVVALENAPSSMSGDLHDDRLGDSGSPEIAHGRSPEIVEEEAGYARSGARKRPAFAEVFDRV